MRTKRLALETPETRSRYVEFEARAASIYLAEPGFEF
jgi:hypothetical protein